MVGAGVRQILTGRGCTRPTFLKVEPPAHHPISCTDCLKILKILPGPAMGVIGAVSGVGACDAEFLAWALVHTAHRSQQAEKDDPTPH